MSAAVAKGVDEAAGPGVAVFSGIAVLGGTAVAVDDGSVVGTTNDVGPVVAMMTGVGLVIGSVVAPEPISAGPEAQADMMSTRDTPSAASDFGAATGCTRFVLRRRT